MKPFAIGCLALFVVFVLGTCGTILVIVAPGGSLVPHKAGESASDFAKQDICGGASDCPLLQIYMQAAQQCPGLSWSIVAAIGKIETNHGRSTLPGVHSGANSAGAMGPMQFLAGTWAAFGDGVPAHVYDMAYAAPAAARYLCSNGGGIAAKLRDAIWHYNHAWWYVAEILAMAARYVVVSIVGGLAGVGQAGNPFIGCRPGISQGFGPSSLQFEPIINGVHFHTGIDLTCPAGTPIRSLTTGNGTYIPENQSGGFGNLEVVDSTFGVPGLAQAHYYVLYAHMLPGSGKTGQVNAGDTIGREGSTGYSTGPHLHFELDAGRNARTAAINPQPLLQLG